MFAGFSLGKDFVDKCNTFVQICILVYVSVKVDAGVYASHKELSVS